MSLSVVKSMIESKGMYNKFNGDDNLLALTLPHSWGYSGQGGGINLNNSNYDCPDDHIITEIYIETAGNIKFQLIDGSTHIIPVDDRTALRPYFVKKIYGFHSGTTARGIHVFGQ